MFGCWSSSFIDIYRISHNWIALWLPISPITFFLFNGWFYIYWWNSWRYYHRLFMLKVRYTSLNISYLILWKHVMSIHICHYIIEVFDAIIKRAIASNFKDPDSFCFFETISMRHYIVTKVAYIFFIWDFRKLS